MNNVFKKDDKIGETIYPVSCDCGWFGMRDECKYGKCPNCHDRVRKEQGNRQNKILCPMNNED